MLKKAGTTIIAEEAIKLVQSIPIPLILGIAHTVGDSERMDWQISRTRILQGILHPHYRDLVSEFIDCWQSCAADVSPQAVSLSLLTAACGEKGFRENRTAELVWTGPDIGIIPVRRTEQALLQLINSAVQRLLIVSYAVYNIPHICDALIKSAKRGVLITVVVETPDRIEGQNMYSTLKALGSSVIDRCQVYLWPPEKRERDDHGKLGTLHVKCAVADGQWLFLSSANLTEYAFTLNMELGLLINGGELPESVETQFQAMIQAGFLVKIDD